MATEISENLPEIIFHKVEHYWYRAESKFRISKNHGGFDAPYQRMHKATPHIIIVTKTTLNENPI